MSVLVTPNEGELILLDMIKDALDVKLILFKTNITVDQDLEYGDLVEANYSGYASVDLDGSDFNAVSTVSNKAQLIATSYSEFVHNGGGTANDIYGYAVVSPSATPDTVLWAEKFDAMQTLSANGDRISLKCKITLNSEN